MVRLAEWGVRRGSRVARPLRPRALRVDVVAAADVRQDHRELVATHPRDPIRAPHGAQHPRGGLAQRGVARAVRHVVAFGEFDRRTARTRELRHLLGHVSYLAAEVEAEFRDLGLRGDGVQQPVGDGVAVSTI